MVSHLVVGRLHQEKGMWKSLSSVWGWGKAQEPWLYLSQQAAYLLPLIETELSGSPVCSPQRRLYLLPPVPGLARASQGASAYCLVTGASSFFRVTLTIPPPE